MKPRCLVLVCVLCLTPVWGQISDTTPPQLASFSFSPTEIDVTIDPAVVTISVEATDDFTGVQYVWLGFRSQGGQWRTAPNFSLVEGTAQDGRWEGEVLFSIWSEDGLWSVADFIIVDGAGNFTNPDPASLPGNELTVLSIPDVSPPEVVPSSISFDPASVDVSGGAQEVSLFLDITDDRSGIDHFSVEIGSPSAHWVSFAMYPAIPISGDVLNGRFKATAIVPQFVQPGDWTIGFMSLGDRAGNRNEIHGDALADLDPPTLHVASDPADLAPPQLHGVRLVPDFVDATKELWEDRRVKVQLDLEDNLSGVRTIFILMYRSPSGGQWAGFAMGGPQLVSGDELFGTWEGTFSLARFAEAGTWKLDALHIYDSVYNGLSLNSEDLAAFDPPIPDLVVVLPSLELDGEVVDPTVDTVIADEVFEERAVLTIPGGVLDEPTTVAIDVFESELDVEVPSGFVSPGTRFVNIVLDPEPLLPLPSPGLSLVLPLVDYLTPGTQLDLFRIDPATGGLVPSIGIDLLPVIGTVDAGGLSASFHGIAYLSVVVGLLPEIVEVSIDIKFCSNPNSYNCKKRGVVPVTVFGNDTGLSVNAIDIASLQLCLAGDLAVCTQVTPRSWSMADRGDPLLDLGAEQCTVVDFAEQDYRTPDGIIDLDVGFDSRELAELIGCGDLSKKDASPTLVLKGLTLDGIGISSVPMNDVGVDQLYIQNK